MTVLVLEGEQEAERAPPYTIPCGRIGGAPREGGATTTYKDPWGGDQRGDLIGVP